MGFRALHHYYLLLLLAFRAGDQGTVEYVCGYLHSPEQGRTLDEVQQMFRSSRPYFYSVGPLSLQLGGTAVEEDRLSIADREELGDGGTEGK